MEPPQGPQVVPGALVENHWARVYIHAYRLVIGDRAYMYALYSEMTENAFTVHSVEFVMTCRVIKRQSGNM